MVLSTCMMTFSPSIRDADRLSLQHPFHVTSDGHPDLSRPLPVTIFCYPGPPPKSCTHPWHIPGSSLTHRKIRPALIPLLSFWIIHPKLTSVGGPSFTYTI